MHPVAVTPVKVAAPVIRDDDRIPPGLKKTYSHMVSTRAVLQTIANDPRMGWWDASLLIEDDIALTQGILADQVMGITKHVVALANRTRVGLFYLGMCLTTDRAEDSCDPPLQDVDGVVFRPCSGRCAHAWGVQKWRAGWLYDELLMRASARREFPPDNAFWDMLLHYGTDKHGRPVVAGANLGHVRAERGHIGVFYQDRLTFPSEIAK